MAVFRSQRRLLGRSRAVRTTSGRGRAALVLMAVAGGFLWLGVAFPDDVAKARARLSGPLASALEAVRAPFEPVVALGTRIADLFDLQEELERLRRENDELKGWQWRALELERRLADLSALNKVVFEPGHDFLTTSLKARSVGAARHTALIGIGRDSGVPDGAAVLNQRGLVGITFEVGPRTSRLLFVTDGTARVNVSVGRSGVTTTAVGTGGRYLTLADDERGLDIAVGDEVVTAGDGRALPRGLRVGRIASTAHGLRVDPYVDFNTLEYVSVMLPADPLGNPRRDGAGDRLASAPPAHGAQVHPDKAGDQPGEAAQSAVGGAVGDTIRAE